MFYNMVFRGTFIISGNPIKNKLVLISDYGEKGNVRIILEMSLDSFWIVSTPREASSVRFIVFIGGNLSPRKALKP